MIVRHLWAGTSRFAFRLPLLPLMALVVLLTACSSAPTPNAANASSQAPAAAPVASAPRAASTTTAPVAPAVGAINTPAAARTQSAPAAPTAARTQSAPAAPTAAVASPVAPATAAPAAPAPVGNRTVVLATTTSTQDSGLLDMLVPLFEQQSGYQVKTVSVGTGAALALGARGEADVALVHAPDAEKQWMDEGNGTERLLVMHNDFIIVGPPNDPAGIRGQGATAALTAIAQRAAPWVSRDDHSGTDQLEKKLWKEAGINPAGTPWYISSGQSMGATLTLADQKDAYTMSDRATYLARRATLQSQILVEGDPQLLNIYHVMPVNPQKFPGVSINAAGGKAFADFMVAPATQRVIADFGKDKFGQPLFFPDAGKPE